MLKCKECKVCNGVACAGQIPGLGGKGSGQSFIRNVEELKKVRLNMDVLMEDGEMDLSCAILGMNLAMPIMIAPIAGIENNYGAPIKDIDYVKMTLRAAEKTGIRAFTGDGIHMDTMFVDPVRAIDENGGKGIVTIKPWMQKGVDDRIDAIQGMHYEVAAMDIDSAGLPLLREGNIPVENKNVQKLKYVKERIGHPFIVKGIMTVRAAKMALEAGADAIVVSNHGGRVLDDCLATVEVLPEIVKAVGNHMTILVDGGIRSGIDVFKVLALGADVVLVGRPFALSCVKDGEEGLVKMIEKFKEELFQTMRMTGCRSLKDITSDKVRYERM